MAALGYEVTALDISRPALQLLRKHALERRLVGRIKTIRADMRAWPFPHNAFDVIVAYTSLDHIEMPSAINVVRGAANALKSGGHFLVTLFSSDDPNICPPDMTAISPTISWVRHAYTLDDLRTLLAPVDVFEKRQLTFVDTSHGKPHSHVLWHTASRKRNML